MRIATRRIWLDKVRSESSSSWGSVSVNDLRPPPGRRTRPGGEQIGSASMLLQAASDRARGDARHTRNRGDAAISRGLELPPQRKAAAARSSSMRQHRRVALLDESPLIIPKNYDAPRRHGNPLPMLSSQTEFSYCLTGPKYRAGPAGHAEVPSWRQADAIGGHPTQTIISAVYPRSHRAPAPIYTRAVRRGCQ